MTDITYPCFIACLDGRGRWHWTYYVQEHQAIARSTEGYINKHDCERAVREIQASSESKIHFVDL